MSFHSIPSCFAFYLLNIYVNKPIELDYLGHFDGKAMPSAGPLPFLQGILCTTNNTCHAKATADELPGQVQAFNTSL